MSPRSTSRENFAAGFAHLVLDVARERTHLPVRVAADDDDTLEQRCQFGGIDDFDITALDVLKGVDHDFFELRCIH
jgi:hypothetical protein